MNDCSVLICALVSLRFAWISALRKKTSGASGLSGKRSAYLSNSFAAFLYFCCPNLNSFASKWVAEGSTGPLHLVSRGQAPTHLGGKLTGHLTSTALANIIQRRSACRRGEWRVGWTFFFKQACFLFIGNVLTNACTQHAQTCSDIEPLTRRQGTQHDPTCL